MIAVGKFKKGLKSDVNSRLKSDPIIDVDFGCSNNANVDYVYVFSTLQS